MLKETVEEKNTKNIILIGSTFIVIAISFIIAYILINTEIKEFKNHLQTVKQTLLKREKTAIKAEIDNFIYDIEYEENLKQREIKKRVKNQTLIAYEIFKSMLPKNLTIKSIETVAKTISKNSNLEFFVLYEDGTLIYNDKKNIPKGTNIFSMEDINGKKFIQQILKESGFVDYQWFVPITNKVSKKITYSKKIKELGITIGFAEFLTTQHSLHQNFLTKIERENFSDNNFIFIYEIMSLSSSKKYSKLILEKNIITDEEELIAIENSLANSNYEGNDFYEYDDKLIYSSFIYDKRIFISVGVYLNSIEKIIQKETLLAKKNLSKKTTSLIINIFGLVAMFFLFSFFVVKKIETLFESYRSRIEKSQQMLIQKSKMASMGEMIGNIAHQWRQPLAQLSGIFLDVETAHAHKELDQKYLEKRVDQANNLLEYMSKTIDDFKEFYNPKAPFVEFSLEDSIQNALHVIGSSLEHYNIEIVLHVDKSLHVKGHANQFSQVILNLLSNAKDIAILRDIKNAKVEIFTTCKNEIISLHVEDNCGGIDENKLEKIFEPYYTTKYNYGTGIGLYMSKLIIESNIGGKIFATNIIPNRARFTITLQKDTKSNIN